MYYTSFLVLYYSVTYCAGRHKIQRDSTLTCLVPSVVVAISLVHLQLPLSTLTLLPVGDSTPRRTLCRPAVLDLGLSTTTCAIAGEPASYLLSSLCQHLKVLAPQRLEATPVPLQSAVDCVSKERNLAGMRLEIAVGRNHWIAFQKWNSVRAFLASFGSHLRMVTSRATDYWLAGRTRRV